MQFEVETLELADAKRLIAVPTNENGFFVDIACDIPRVVKRIRVEGVSGEHIEAAERGELSELALFDLKYGPGFGHRYKALEGITTIAIGVEGSPQYSDIHAFQEARLYTSLEEA